jgi:quinol monooxygenase YgiN
VVRAAACRPFGRKSHDQIRALRPAGSEARQGAGGRRFPARGLAPVQAESGTVAWFGLQTGPSSFAIFDAFPDEAGRNAHLNGKVAAALMEKADELFASPPRITKLDVLAAKLPG